MTTEEVKPIRMTAAEFKTIRESLGVSIQWLAKEVGVKPRSVMAWESGQTEITASAAHMLERLELAVEIQVDDAVTELLENPDTPEEITLIRYRNDTEFWQSIPGSKPFTATMHAAMLARARRDLKSLGKNVEIKFMDLVAYLAWLGERPDTEAERSAWAATLCNPHARTRPVRQK
jgi:transcriptional regulator with XRE-family HTH domain